MKELAIEARDLVKTYPGNVRALDELSFAVAGGTIFGLLGPNGAGKSTTIKILATLTRPDSGGATVAGHDVLREPAQARRSIGVVGQRHGLGGAELKTRVASLLDRFLLTPAADREARTYSGGMQRKLDVAMGLIHRPRVLFLDEPTTGLDPEARSDLWKEITRLAHDDGITVLLTTHYLEEADRLAHRLAIVDRGRVVAEGTPDALKGELSGDAVQIELSETPGDSAVAALLSSVRTVHDVTVTGSTVRARADHGGSAVPAMITALEAGGARVSSVRVTRPSLDDVYLRHTGRTFNEADQA